MSTMVGLVGTLALISGLGSGFVALHQAYRCLYRRSSDGRCHWSPGTEGISGPKWAVRVWVNIIWLLYAFSGAEVEWLIVCTSLNMLAGSGSILTMVMSLPPKRRTWERATVAAALICVLAAGTLLLTDRASIKECPKFFAFMLGFGNTGLMLIGETAQVVLLIVLKRAGRQTLFECCWSGGDWGVWALYGGLLGKPELLWSCALVSMFFWCRFIILVRDPEKRAEFWMSRTGRLLRCFC